jgi:hypothetical protein
MYLKIASQRLTKGHSNTDFSSTGQQQPLSRGKANSLQHNSEAGLGVDRVPGARKSQKCF